MKLTIDFETRSKAVLGTVGAWAYSLHPSTQVFCIAVKVDDEPTHIWVSNPFYSIIEDWLGYDLTLELPIIYPDKVFDLIEDADIIEAHNVFFERAIIKNTLPHWPQVPSHKWRCSMAKAAASAYPQKLDLAAKALKLSIQKDTDGHFIMLKLSKPRKPTENNPSIWDETPKKLLKLMHYCIRDVDTEHALSARLRDLSPHELKIWQVDQEINLRGVHVDTEAAKNAIKIIQQHEDKLLSGFQDITGLNSPRQVEATRLWLADRGVHLTNLTKDSVTKALETPGLSDDLRQVLHVRRSLAKSSTGKFKHMAASYDDRLHDTMNYCGAHPGRWAGRRIQPHNMPREMPENWERMIDDVKNGIDAETFELLYGDPIRMLSGCVRGFICAPKGKKLLCGDYSSIEGRGLAWTADEKWVLDNYEAGKDPYCVFASQIHHKPWEEIKKGYKAGIKEYVDMRFEGKTGELACIAEGSLVLTDKGLIPIEKVTVDMRLWDGIEWINHGGIIYKGVKKVISYDGLQATPEHIVYTENGEEIELQKAAWSEQRLAQTGINWKAVRYDRNNIRPHKGRQWMPKSILPMSWLRAKKVDQFKQSINWKNRWLSKMQSTCISSKVATKKNVSCERQMPKSKKSSIQKLRSERDRISIQITSRSCNLGTRKFRPKKKIRIGPHRQQWALRTNKSKMGNTTAKSRKYEINKVRSGFSQVSTITPRNKICGLYIKKTYSKKINFRTDNKEVSQVQPQTKRRVWDILNCGPRNRFTVSGRLVHNCGYEGGEKSVKNFAPNMPLKRREEIVKIWRANRPMTVKYWKKMRSLSIAAVMKPGTVYRYNKIAWGMHKGDLLCKLPSGRYLTYHDPQIRMRQTPWGEPQPALTFMRAESGKWLRVSTFGGRLTQNQIEGICRDILADAMLRVHKTFPIMFHVHDEIIAEVINANLEEFLEAISIVPKWAKGFPIGADGFITRRYHK